MIEIPAGKFIMGSDKVDLKKKWKEFGSREEWYLNEHPQHQIFLPDYLIDKYEVSYQTYRDFVKQAQSNIPNIWLKNGYALSLKKEALKTLDTDSLRGIIVDVMRLDINTLKMHKDALIDAIQKRWAYQDNLPVSHVSWFEAKSFCQFHQKRLPTEAEWEKAARGASNVAFIFDNTWHAGWSNVGEEYWEDGVAPRGSYPKDRSEYGVMDMAGNVYEWVDNWYQAYPQSDYQHKDFGKHYKVVRGSGYGKDGHYFLQHYQRAAYRSRLHPDAIQPGQGFRCAK